MKHACGSLVFLLLLGLAAPVAATDRPPIEFVPATSLVAKCRIAVLFNENERAVKESDYMDATYCLGIVRGIIGVNEHLGPAYPLFCLPMPGIKAWHGAR